MIGSRPDPNVPVLVPYLRDVAAELRDPDRGLADVLAQLPTTPQAKPRWPFRRRSTLDPHPTHGRSQTMFSATRFVVAAVIAALVGGTLFAAFVTRQDGETAPFVGATATVSAPPDATVQPTAEPTPTAVATASPRDVDGDPVVDSDLLHGIELTTQVVEPDVVHIVSDGVRRRLVTGRNPASHRVVAGLDGSVWIFGPDRFFRVGSQKRHRYWQVDGPRGNLALFDFAIAPDGTVWASGADLRGDTPRGADASRLHSFDGVRWRVRKRVPALDLGDEPSPQVLGSVHVTADGTVWAVSTNDDEPRTTLHRLDEDGWKAFRVRPRHGSSFDEVVTIDGASVTIEDRDRTHRFKARTGAPDGQGGFWLAGDWDYPEKDGPGKNGAFQTEGLVHFDGEDWQTWDLGLFDTDSDISPIFQDVVDGQPFFEGERFVDGRWEPTLGGRDVWPPQVDGPLDTAISADGRAWWPGHDLDDAERILASARVNELFETQDEYEAFMLVHGNCGGMISFDGVSETRYLEDLCVTSFDIAADGSVWVLARPRPTDQARDGARRVDAYVIRPGGTVASNQ